MKVTRFFVLLLALLIPSTGCKSPEKALMGAVLSGDDAGVKASLDKGANVNVKDSKGRTALILATQEGFTETIKVLLENGADVDARDHFGKTSLMIAAKEGYTDILNLLLGKGADANARDTNSWTPLMYAAFEGHERIVGVLLENGADVNVENDYGITALKLAYFKGYTDVVQLLKRSGSQEITGKKESAPAISRAPVSQDRAATEKHGDSLDRLMSGLHGNLDGKLDGFIVDWRYFGDTFVLIIDKEKYSPGDVYAAGMTIRTVFELDEVPFPKIFVIRDKFGVELGRGPFTNIPSLMK